MYTGPSNWLFYVHLTWKVFCSFFSVGLMTHLVFPICTEWVNVVWFWLKCHPSLGSKKINQNPEVLSDLRLGKCLGLFSRLVQGVIHDHRDEGQLLLSYKNSTSRTQDGLSPSWYFISHWHTHQNKGLLASFILPEKETILRTDHTKWKPKLLSNSYLQH